MLLRPARLTGLVVAALALAAGRADAAPVPADVVPRCAEAGGRCDAPPVPVQQQVELRPAGPVVPNGLGPVPPAVPDSPRTEDGRPNPGDRTYRALRTIDRIVVDGKMNERTWQQVPPDDRFAERQPDVGATPPVRTTIRVAYDDTNLYVFVEAFAEQDDIIVRTLRRDNGGIYADDALTVKIDPYHRGRDGYSLGVNADGAQIDALGLDDGRQYVTEWDGVWFAETQRTDFGYTAEYQIPFAVLGIKSADSATIGFDLSRDHPSRNATYDWRLFVPPASPMSASQFGDVVGLRNIKGQRAIEFTPYALARTNFRPQFSADPARRPNLATGGDLRVQVGASSYVESSFLTDFAQVEADEVQVARDRFPLFFPERRPFFINGLESFNFGRPQEGQLFFSRRVGLVGGQPVPILGGAKAYGRSDRLTYGFLQVQTLGAPNDPERGLVESYPDSYTVGRIRVQATDALSVGMIGMGQHRFLSEDEDNMAGGLDARVVALDGQLQYYGFVAGTYAETPGEPTSSDEVTGAPIAPTPGEDAVGHSGSHYLEYRGLYVRPSVFWLWSSETFDPRMGFYRRPGSSRQQVNLSFVPRPRVLGLREVDFGPTYSIETDSRYELRLGQSASGNVGATWRNGARVSYNISHFVDDVQDDFELYTHNIEAQRYTGFRHSWSGETPSRRALGLNASYEYIEIFGGTAHQPSAGLTARLGKHFTVGGRYTHLAGHFQDPGENFNFGFANGNVDVAITRNLAFDNLARLDLSPLRQRFGLQSRIRWRFAPGSDLFVVYRANFPFGEDDPSLPAREPFHELTVKMSWYLRTFVNR